MNNNGKIKLQNGTDSIHKCVDLFGLALRSHLFEPRVDVSEGPV